MSKIKSIYGSKMANQANTNRRDAMIKAKSTQDALFEQHLEESKSFSLMQGLEEIGFELQEKASPGGYDQVVIGEGDDVYVTGDECYSAINGLASIGSRQYSLLELGHHIAWHRATVNAVGVESKWVNGFWKFGDWKNYQYRYPSSMNSERRENQTKKHECIDYVLGALDPELGGRMIVVLGWEELKEHFRNKLYNRFEMTCPEVWDEIADDAIMAQAKRQYNKGTKANQAPVFPISEERKAFIAQAAQVTSAVYLVGVNVDTERDFMWFYDPNSTKASEQLATALSQGPQYQFTGIKAVEK